VAGLKKKKSWAPAEKKRIGKTQNPLIQLRPWDGKMAGGKSSPKNIRGGRGEHREHNEKKKGVLTFG